MKAIQLNLSVFALAFVLIGCDRDKLPTASTDPSTKPAGQSQPTAAAARPTTQELLSGESHTITLGILPLKLSVPKSWEIDHSSALQSIVGYSPHGPIKISLSDISTPFTDTTLPMMDKQLAKRAAESNGKTAAKPLRPLGASPAKVREQLERVANSPIMLDGHAVQTDVMDWSVDVYVLQEKAYMEYSLHFDSLPVAQYEQDKDFLEKIVGTLQYDASHR